MQIRYNDNVIADVRNLDEAVLIVKAHVVGELGQALEDIARVMYSRDTEEGITTHRYLVVWIGTAREVKFELCY